MSPSANKLRVIQPQFSYQKQSYSPTPQTRPDAITASSAAAVQNSRPKYNISYMSNGDVSYNGQVVGNFLKNDIFSVGPDEWLEKWASENGVKLTANANLSKGKQHAVGTMAKKGTELTNPEITDVSEKRLTDTFGTDTAGRVSDQNQNAATSGLNQMLPLTAATGVRGLAKMSPLNDKSTYGKGFEPELMNPFFTK